MNWRISALTQQIMLTDGIAAEYRDCTNLIASSTGVAQIMGTAFEILHAAPYLFAVSGDDWLANTALKEEVFGLLGIIARVRDMAQMQEIASRIEGELTCTIHMDDVDRKAAQSLLPVIERKAGRILANDFPTGVEVAGAMVHGGLYPASTNIGATSVGTLSIRQFLRLFCCQDLDTALLPEAFDTE